MSSEVNYATAQFSQPAEGVPAQSVQHTTVAIVLRIKLSS